MYLLLVPYRYIKMHIFSGVMFYESLPYVVLLNDVYIGFHCVLIAKSWPLNEALYLFKDEKADDTIKHAGPIF